MAKAPEKSSDDAAAVPAKAGKKPTLIILASLILLLVIGGGAGFFMLKKNQQPATEDEEAKLEKIKRIKAETPPVMVKLDQFTVKLQPEDDKAEQYMQAVVEFEVLDSQSADRVKVFMSKIRAKILLILLGKTPSEISSPQGVELLTTEIRNETNHILDGTTRPPATPLPGPDDSVQAVYLTQFIIQ
ncbi:MAG: flagellar basal body-associated FliL family protein [Sterolibacterium sp.]|nr:flagellar basal body-associated FliL family protein [Sterolibacterium sp.]